MKDYQLLKEQVSKLIGAGKTVPALKLLLEEDIPALRKTLHSLEGRKSRLTQQQRAGTISQAEATLESNSINAAILDIVYELADPAKHKLSATTARKRTRLPMYIIGGVLLLAALFWAVTSMMGPAPLRVVADYQGESKNLLIKQGMTLVQLKDTLIDLYVSEDEPYTDDQLQLEVAGKPVGDADWAKTLQDLDLQDGAKIALVPEFKWIKGLLFRHYSMPESISIPEPFPDHLSIGEFKKKLIDYYNELATKADGIIVNDPLDELTLKLNGQIWEENLSLREAKASTGTLVTIEFTALHLEIGDPFKGGTIFKIDKSGQRPKGVVYRPEHNQYLNWEDARVHCASLSVDGNDNWRLPTVQELEELRQQGRITVKVSQGNDYWGTKEGKRKTILTYLIDEGKLNGTASSNEKRFRKVVPVSAF